MVAINKIKVTKVTVSLINSQVLRIITAVINLTVDKIITIIPVNVHFYVLAIETVIIIKFVLLE